MKKKILSFFMAVLAVTSVCSAQTEKYKGDYYFYRKSHNNEVINQSYNMPVLVNASGIVENLHGVSLDYTRMISLCDHSPLFIETGIGFGGYFGNKFTEPVDETWTDVNNNMKVYQKII